MNNSLKTANKDEVVSDGKDAFSSVTRIFCSPMNGVYEKITTPGESSRANGPGR